MASEERVGWELRGVVLECERQEDDNERSNMIPMRVGACGCVPYKPRSGGEVVSSLAR